MSEASGPPPRSERPASDRPERSGGGGSVSGAAARSHPATPAIHTCALELCIAHLLRADGATRLQSNPRADLPRRERAPGCRAENARPRDAVDAGSPPGDLRVRHATRAQHQSASEHVTRTRRQLLSRPAPSSPSTTSGHIESSVHGHCGSPTRRQRRR